jgi:hypothetical protein
VVCGRGGGGVGKTSLDMYNVEEYLFSLVFFVFCFLAP